MVDDHDICYDLLISLRQIIRATDLHSKQLVKKYGLTGPQLVVIQVIAREGEISIGSLAKKVSLSQATVTNIVERLEKNGVLKRKKGETDKRRVLVAATEKALDIIRNKPSLLHEQFVTRFNKLESWEQTLLLSSLQRIASMMNAENLEVAPILFSGPINTSEAKE
ncbi:MarR family winged helix-turn-helix transcriptional regulator [Desulfoluna spongiiphila]|uniref:Transcriptional regulator, MarR family n=1 Tax=Desulfoluna spongiiphila TaxID=419481 RepID=A0A1G5CVU1_9BACT|nr:MarR family transcriptional regulator [Desulfoluna spongiiphila]SCY06593.1 transcriptional regulator, MarR family [Desulfoluna spongiiphila]VVS92440.1 marr-type hth domain [Desulfoluna spongiiphila]